MKTNYLLASLLTLATLTAQLGLSASDKDDQDAREVSMSFNAGERQVLVMDAKSTDITIDTWTKPEVQLKAKVIFKGEPSDKIMAFLDEFEDIVVNNIYESSNKLEISTDLDVPNKVQIGSKFIGVQISYDRDELEIFYDLMVPESMPLDIKNSYRDLIMKGKHTGNVSIDHYSGDLIANEFDKLNLALKYGKARMSKVNTGRFELYEQELEIDRLGSAEMEAKYSNVNISQSDVLSLISYESKYQLELCDKIEGEIKYTEIISKQDISTIDLLSAYESDMEIEKIFSLKIEESKYSDIVLGSVDQLSLPNSYEDKLEIDLLDQAAITSKYLELDVRQLIKQLKINGYETDITIGEINSELKLVSIDGKYNDLNLSTKGTPINITANLTYGNVDFDASQFERTVYIKENSKLEMELESKRGGTEAPIIELLGYEVSAKIN